ncbi:hypothetical protein PI125_g14094 [Phytophthora idaei]|nr:hypothetical protein PI125_g14094 [Phytophthora idaei]KAG3155744.1 hypothetical protein PI126_g9038 [Phytophthora idaei]
MQLGGAESALREMVERQHNELATCKSELHQLQRRLQQQTHYDEALDDALRRESVLKDAAAEQQARLKYLENVNASLVAALDSAKKELGSSQKEFSQIIEQREKLDKARCEAEQRH